MAETHAQVATGLVIDGCLPMLIGQARLRFETQGKVLGPEDRAKLMQRGVNQLGAEGTTFFYPLGSSAGVFCDVSPKAMTVWFNDPTAKDAYPAFEAALKQAYPEAKLVDERPHPDNKDLHVRFHQVPLERELAALIESTAPKRGARGDQFAVRVTPLLEKRPPTPGEAITPSSLVAFLAMHSVIPLMQGKLSARTPAVGVPLTEEQRRTLGLAEGGSTLIYQVGDAEVVMDIVGNTATISFAKSDVGKAMETFARLLGRDRPAMRQTQDIPHPRGGKKRLRVYEGDVDPGLLCKIEADYPQSGAQGADNRFVVRVSAFQRQKN